MDKQERIINISTNAVIARSAQLEKSVLIGEFSIIGKNVFIGSNCKIQSHVIIRKNANVGSGTHIEDFCRIGEDTTIGRNCRLVYGTKIYGYVQIGKKCVIGGFICEDVKIGNNCRVFGELIHLHKINPEKFRDLSKWDKGGEPAPILEDNVFVAFGARVIGGVTIGKGSYIVPGAIVTKDVPKGSYVTGNNCVTRFKKFLR